MPGVHIELLDSTAGVTNLAMLQRNEVDAVSTYADIAYLASVGQLEDMAGPFDEVRAIAALPIRELQVVIARSRPFDRFGTFAGAVFRWVLPYGVAITAGLLLSAFGIGSHDIKTEHLAFDEAVLPVMNGEIDGVLGREISQREHCRRHTTWRTAAAGGGAGNRAVSRRVPFLRATVIPAGTYPGIDHVVHTVGVDGIFVCRADLDERLVYNLTKAFFQAVSTAGREVRMLRGFNMSRAAATRFRCILAPRGYRETEMPMKPRALRGDAAYSPDPHNRPRRSGARTLLVWLSGSERMAASTAALIERNAQDDADRLVTALARDMRGAQALVLANRDSGDYASQSLADFSHEVASAFTRYIYPESFFGWRQADDEVVFFNRANRPPPWMTGVINATRARRDRPQSPDCARCSIGSRGREKSPELCALRYRAGGSSVRNCRAAASADVYHERLESIAGFTVNLAWYASGISLSSFPRCRGSEKAGQRWSMPSSTITAMRSPARYGVIGLR